MCIIINIHYKHSPATSVLKELAMKSPEVLSLAWLPLLLIFSTLSSNVFMSAVSSITCRQQILRLVFMLLDGVAVNHIRFVSVDDIHLLVDILNAVPSL